MLEKQFISFIVSSDDYGAICIEIGESLFNFSNQGSFRKSYTKRREVQPSLNKSKNSQLLERFDDHKFSKFFGNFFLQMGRHLGQWHAFMVARNTSSDNMTIQ